MSWSDDHPVLFHHGQSGPYQQYIGVGVQDHGNGLPITIGCQEGDPPGATSTSMDVGDAELFYRQLGQAIEVAKDNNLS